MKINQDTMRWVVMASLLMVIVSAAKNDMKAESVTSDDTAFAIEMIDPADHDCRFIDPKTMETKPQENKGKIGHRWRKRGLFSCLLPKADDKKTKVEHVMVGYHGTCANRAFLLNKGFKPGWVVRPKHPRLGRDRLHTTDNLDDAAAFAVERCSDFPFACYILMDASVLKSQQKTYIPRVFKYSEFGIVKSLHQYERHMREYEAQLFEASNFDSENSEATESTEPVRFGKTTHTIDGVTFNALQVAWPKHVLKHMKVSCYNAGFYDSDDVVKYEKLISKSADPKAEVDPLWGRILGAEKYYDEELH